MDIQKVLRTYLLNSNRCREGFRLGRLRLLPSPPKADSSGKKAEAKEG